MLPRPEFLLGLVDIVILALVVLLTVYMVLRRKTSPLTLLSGRSIVLIGILLAAVSLVVTMPSPSRDWIVAPDGANGDVGAWLAWFGHRAAILMIGAGLLVAFLQGQRTEQAARASAAKIRAARERATQSEERFRSLFETSTNSLSCWTLQPPLRTSLPLEEQIRRTADARLTECNDVFAIDIGHEKAVDIIGMPMSDLDSVKDEEAHRKFMTALIDGDYRLTDYDLIFKAADGGDRAIRLNVTGIIQDGMLLRFWSAATNTLTALRTQKALYRHRVFQEMLAGISSRLVMTTPGGADEVMVSSMRDVCQFLGGNRITLSWVDMERLVADVLYTWHAGGSEMIMHIDLDHFPYLGEKLLAGTAMRIADIEALPAEAERDRDVLRAVGMRSFMFLPLIVEEKIVGLLTMGNDEKPCDWTEQELLDLRVFGDLFANFVLRTRQRRALDDALEGLQQATERLEAENIYLRSEIKLDHDFGEIIGASDAIRRSLHMVEQVADTMTPVLILGETGTGKELVARALHEHSSRRDRPLVKVNCAALPANLIESELFGYEKGAFTGADSAKRGRFDLADGSTLFLDEIGEIPLELQPKLLRVLQEGEFERLGGTRTIKVDVRIIAATNRDLWDACERGEFRSDLYYRINTFPIEIPPLRERGNDIRLLAEHFVQQHSQRLGREITAISARMMEQLEDYHWPGNVRELEGVIQRALISSSGPVLELGQALGGRGERAPAVDAQTGNLQSVERDHIIAVLKRTDWKIAGPKGAAVALAVPPSTLRSKMKKLGITRPG